VTSYEESVFAEVQDARPEVKRNGIAPAKPKGAPACYAMTRVSLSIEDVPCMLHGTDVKEDENTEKVEAHCY